MQAETKTAYTINSAKFDRQPLVFPILKATVKLLTRYSTDFLSSLFSASYYFTAIG